MHEMVQLLKKIADRGSWSRFATLLAFALFVALYKSVTDLASLARLLIATVSLEGIAFYLEYLHCRFLSPTPTDPGPRPHGEDSTKARKAGRRLSHPTGGNRPVKSRVKNKGPRKVAKRTRGVD
jgi:hypothetical protein